MEDYDIPGAEGLDLHHFYRAMAWLGEEMEEKSEDALAPRCVKDAIEEKLFDKRRDLFADLSAVFMDTTSLSFYGEGGETLGEHGYSKDYRKVLDGAAMIQSMSRKGNCWDNAPMESCFGTIETALVHRACYPTREAARHDLFAYIEGYCNRQRLHSALGYITPEQASAKPLDPVSTKSGEGPPKRPVSMESSCSGRTRK